MLSGCHKPPLGELYCSEILLTIYKAKSHFSEFLLFADDLEIFRGIKSAEDSKLLQSDVDSA
jgi:hypothetical protein